MLEVQQTTSKKGLVLQEQCLLLQQEVLEAGCSQKKGRTKKEKIVDLMIKERRKHQRAKRHLLLKIADKGFDVITEKIRVHHKYVDLKNKIGLERKV